MKRIFLVCTIVFLSGQRQAYTQWVQTSGPLGGDVHCFAVSGANLFVGTSRGVFLSIDNGTSWVSTSLTNTLVYALAVSDTNLFAGTGGSVFFSQPTTAQAGLQSTPGC